MMAEKWKILLVLALAEVLAMSLWFSATAITPSLTTVLDLSPGDAAWLTMSVQLGFVLGTFLSALFNVSDVTSPRFIFAAGALLGSLANGAIAIVPHNISYMLPLRFLTGFALAAVYPVGMKILVTWMKKDRGIGLGVLVGAVIVGSAAPHLIRALCDINDWRQLIAATSGLALLGGMMVGVYGHLGPYGVGLAPFRWRYIGPGLTG